ncbi:v-type proton atpase subunit g [Anaeramoeba ignava]|uniref:V-type proton ATPase subunit G n=1 Tax=Anaeramoeba ignava TaxID=1746090 RepID=A0A9Q0L852_ANAIG|nr:v-type proton atpase subunit g [Anaeramoeba ignava]
MQSSDPNIQRLLQAEQFAAKIVEDANREKVQILREEDVKAMKDIDQMREQKMKEYEKFKNDHLGSLTKIEEKYQKFTQEKIQEIFDLSTKNKEKIIQLLLDKVKDVDVSFEDQNKKKI